MFDLLCVVCVSVCAVVFVCLCVVVFFGVIDCVMMYDVFVCGLFVFM